MSSKFGASYRVFVLDQRFVKGLIKICRNFWSFCMNDSEQNETKRHLILKKATIFSLKPTHHPFLIDFERKRTDTLAELDNIVH